jgi:ubiquinone biosynthesis protein
MLKKLVTLFKLGRKVAKSDILKITSKFQEPPLIIKIIFKILAFSFSKKN